MKFAVIVCSNSGIDYVDHNYNIPVFRSVINFGNESYEDYTGIKADEFYEKLKQNLFPTTAFVSIGKMIDTFDRLKHNGYTGVLVITISKSLSGLYDSVVLASKEVKDFEVIGYNSKTLAFPQTYMALEASRMFEENKSLDEVINRLNYLRDKQKMYFSVDTLEYLIKNGRLSKVAGVVANLASIRPLLTLDENGKVVTLTKTRTSKKSRQLMIDTLLKEIENKNVIVYISHANSIYLEEVLQILNKTINKIEVCYLTPVVGAHAGPNAIALGYIEI